MFSPKIRYTLYGVLVSTSLITLAVQAAGSDGVFGDYFTKMTGYCISDTVLTGFDNTTTLTYGTKQCTSLKSLIGNIFGASTAPAGKAMVGFDTNGNPKYGSVNWNNNGSDISYTGGRVGIGTSTTPTAKLEVVGTILATGPITGTSFIDKDSAGFRVDPDNMSVMQNLSINNNIIANGEIRGPVFRDTYGAGLYIVDPNGTSYMNAISAASMSVNSTPTSPNNVATKAYVDSKVGNFNPLIVNGKRYQELVTNFPDAVYPLVDPASYNCSTYAGTNYSVQQLGIIGMAWGQSAPWYWKGVPYYNLWTLGDEMARTTETNEKKVKYITLSSTYKHINDIRKGCGGDTIPFSGFGITIVYKPITTLFSFD